MVPTVGRIVHYVSYGTPGGEYESTCRAGIIAEVGAWLDHHVGEETLRLPEGQRERTVVQRWDPEACALVVHNPSGQFFNQRLAHDEDKAPGTWHWPERVEG